MINHKIFICDFNDSFTYNIYSELKVISDKFEISVINFEDIEKSLNKIAKEDQACCVILGPGPGHPEEYSELFPSIKELINNQHVFIMGICLGHQILALLKGMSVIHASNPVHGQVERYKLSPGLEQTLDHKLDIEVQRYNSLAVDAKEINIPNSVETLIEKEELIIWSAKNIISYQFHPESIGTTCPKLFFKPIIDFLL